MSFSIQAEQGSLHSRALETGEQRVLPNPSLEQLVAGPNLQVGSSGAAGLPISLTEHPSVSGAPRTIESTANLDHCATFWEVYNKTADVEDKEFVHASNSEIDVLLIFAGLFSATNTAFIIEAYTKLSSDQATITNDLLRSIVIALHNTTLGPEWQPTLSLEPVRPTSRDVRTCAGFFISLCCSLSAAFGGVLAKQWLTHYDRENDLKHPADRGRERQKKYERRGRWRMDAVVETLPTLLQFSLFFFFLSLVDFLLPLDRRVALVVIVFASLTFLFYVTTICIASIDPNNPFQTRLSGSLRYLVLALKRLAARSNSVVQSIIQLPTPSVGLPLIYAFSRGLQSYIIRIHHSPPLGWPSLCCGMLALVIVWLPAMAIRRGIELLRGSWHSLLARTPAFNTGGVVSSVEEGRCSIPTRRRLKRIGSNFDASCVRYLLQTTPLTNLEHLEGLRQAFYNIPEGRDALVLAEMFIQRHLKPSLDGQGGFIWGISAREFQSHLQCIHVMIVKWRFFRHNPTYLTDSFAPVRNSNTNLDWLDISPFVASLICELWRSFLVSTEVPLESPVYISEILRQLLPPRKKVEHIAHHFTPPEIRRNIKVMLKRCSNGVLSQAQNGKTVVPETQFVYLELAHIWVSAASLPPPREGHHTLDDTSNRMHRRRPYHNYMKAILSQTMWTVSNEDQVLPDMDGFRGIIRIDWLLAVRPAPEELISMQLGSYLSSWLACHGEHGFPAISGAPESSIGWEKNPYVYCYLLGLDCFLKICSGTGYDRFRLMSAMDAAEVSSSLLAIMKRERSSQAPGELWLPAFLCILELYETCWKVSQMDSSESSVMLVNPGGLTIASEELLGLADHVGRLVAGVLPDILSSVDRIDQPPSLWSCVDTHLPATYQKRRLMEQICVCLEHAHAKQFIPVAALEGCIDGFKRWGGYLDTSTYSLGELYELYVRLDQLIPHSASVTDSFHNHVMRAGDFEGSEGVEEVNDGETGSSSDGDSPSPSSALGTITSWVTAPVA